MMMAGVRTCVSGLDVAEREAFFLGYFRRRQEEFDAVVIKPARPICSKEKKAKRDKITLSSAELEILRKLGLC
jgi:hypothetical protein